jgi:hypothetical protein
MQLTSHVYLIKLNKSVYAAFLRKYLKLAQKLFVLLCKVVVKIFQSKWKWKLKWLEKFSWNSAILNLIKIGLSFFQSIQARGVRSVEMLRLFLPEFRCFQSDVLVSTYHLSFPSLQTCLRFWPDAVPKFHIFPIAPLLLLQPPLPVSSCNT